MSEDLVRDLRRQGELAYPEEGAGLILGLADGERRRASQLRPLANRSPESARRRRYEIDPRDLMRVEDEAEQGGLEIVGIYHSHPDHPAAPSETDREWALPWYVYVITSVQGGRAVECTGWRLTDDRANFEPVPIRTEF
jgi:proteasome lid subunit RPN8/RPN11